MRGWRARRRWFVSNVEKLSLVINRNSETVPCKYAWWSTLLFNTPVCESRSSVSSWNHCSRRCVQADSSKLFAHNAHSGLPIHVVSSSSEEQFASFYPVLGKTRRFLFYFNRKNSKPLKQLIRGSCDTAFRWERILTVPDTHTLTGLGNDDTAVARNTWKQWRAVTGSYLGGNDQRSLSHRTDHHQPISVQLWWDVHQPLWEHQLRTTKKRRNTVSSTALLLILRSSIKNGSFTSLIHSVVW